MAFQSIRECLEIETWILHGSLACLVHNGNSRIVVCVAPPAGVKAACRFGIVNSAAGLCRDSVQVIGEAGTRKRRKHPVRKHEIASVEEIIRDVSLRHLGVWQQITVLVAVLDKIEAVHFSFVHCYDGVVITVPNIGRRDIGRGCQGNPLSI